MSPKRVDLAGMDWPHLLVIELQPLSTCVDKGVVVSIVGISPIMYQHTEQLVLTLIQLHMFTVLKSVIQLRSTPFFQVLKPLQVDD